VPALFPSSATFSPLYAVTNTAKVNAKGNQMFIVALLSGSFIGLIASVFAYFALGLGAFAAFSLYLACALVPTLLTVALTVVQALADIALPNRLTAR